MLECVGHTLLMSPCLCFWKMSGFETRVLASMRATSLATYLPSYPPISLISFVTLRVEGYGWQWRVKMDGLGGNRGGQEVTKKVVEEGKKVLRRWGNWLWRKESCCGWERKYSMVGREESRVIVDGLMGNVREDGWANRKAWVVYYFYEVQYSTTLKQCCIFRSENHLASDQRTKAVPPFFEAECGGMKNPACQPWKWMSWNSGAAHNEPINSGFFPASSPPSIYWNGWKDWWSPLAVH